MDCNGLGRYGVKKLVWKTEQFRINDVSKKVWWKIKLHNVVWGLVEDQAEDLFISLYNNP